MAWRVVKVTIEEGKVSTYPFQAASGVNLGKHCVKPFVKIPADGSATAYSGFLFDLSPTHPD